MKKGIAIIMSWILVLMCMGCSSGQAEKPLDDNAQQQTQEKAEETNTENAGGQEAEKITVGVSFMTLNSPFFEAMQKGVEEEAKAAGIEVIVSDAQLNVADQISSVENLIAQKVDVILLNAVDSKAVVPAVEAANTAGIPVICLDVMAEGGDITAFIASNNKAAGEMGGEFIAEQLEGKGKVIILDGPPISSFQERTEGYQAALEKYPDIEIIQKIDAVENSISAFVTAADNILSAYPDVDAVLAVNDYGSIAVESAIESATKDFDIIAVGIDGMDDAIQLILSGDIVAGTVAQQPAEMGRIGIRTALKVVNGESVEENIEVPLKMVSKENAEGFSW